MDVDRLIERDVAAEPLVLKLSRAIGESTACIVKVKLRGEVIAGVGHHRVADPRGLRHPSSCPRDVFVAVREWQLPFLNSLYCNIVAQLSAQLLERHVGFN
jgi:hypothetical protein